MEGDPATPLAMAARGSTRSASFDVELGQALAGFDELRIEDEEATTPVPAAAAGAVAPSTPSQTHRRRNSLPPPAPPFASFFQPTPLSASPIATAMMLMNRRQNSVTKGEIQGRYSCCSSPPPPPSPPPLSLSKPEWRTTTSATPPRSICTLDDPPFEQLDPREEGSTTFVHLPRDVQLRIFALVPEGNGSGGAAAVSSSPSTDGSGGGSKRNAALTCRLFWDLLLDGEAWPRVELNPVTARSAAWLARRSGGGGGGGSFSSLEEGNRRRAETSSPSSSSSALSLSCSSSGIREVTLRPSTETQAVLFNDVFLSTAPGIASLTIDTPWHASPLTNFAFVFWALKFQRSLRHLRVKVQEIDFEALPPNLESLNVECSRFTVSGAGNGGRTGNAGLAEEEGGEEENEENAATDAAVPPTTVEAAATSAALPSLAEIAANSLGGEDDRRHRDDRGGLSGLARLKRLTRLDLAVWSHGAPWQDLTPLLALTKLRSLSLNTHPFESRSGSSSSFSSNFSNSSPSSVNDFTWSRLGSTMPDLRCLTISAAPGFDAPLPSLPAYCDLHVFTRGGFRSPLASSYAANLVSLELKDLALSRFDARILSPCRRLASLDVSFASDAGVVDGLEAVAGSLRSLKTGCPALRLVLPPLPNLEELEAVAFHDLDLSVDRAACAALLCGGKLRSVYLAALDFGVGMHVFVHEAGKRGLDLRFATRPLRAVFTPDQLLAMDLDGNGVEVVG